MIDWDKLRIFYKIAQVGSFSRAAEIMNLSQSSLSRHMTNLEHFLNMSLFHRHSKGLVLTAQGDLLYHASKEIFNKLLLTEALLNESRGTPQGPLRIAASIAFGTRWLIPFLGEFTAHYPKMHLELILRDDRVDLSLREADMSIAFQPSSHPDWVSSLLPLGRYRLYASRLYLEKKGVPLKISDLNHHQLIVYGESAPAPLDRLNSILTLDVKRGKTREPYLVVNSIWGILQSVKSNLGIALLNHFIVKGEGDLVEILPEYDFGTFQKYIIYPEQLRSSRRIAAFQEFIQMKTKETEF